MHYNNNMPQLTKLSINDNSSIGACYVHLMGSAQTAAAPVELFLF